MECMSRIKPAPAGVGDFYADLPLEAFEDLAGYIEHPSPESLEAPWADALERDLLYQCMLRDTRGGKKGWTSADRNVAELMIAICRFRLLNVNERNGMVPRIYSEEIASVYAEAECKLPVARAMRAEVKPWGLSLQQCLEASRGVDLYTTGYHEDAQALLREHDKDHPVIDGVPAQSPHQCKLNIDAAENDKAFPPRTLFDDLARRVWTQAGPKMRLSVPSKEEERFQSSKYYKRHMQLQNYVENRMFGFGDFQPVRLLGKGATGVVCEVKKKDTGARYALKIVSKRKAKLRDTQGVAMNERLQLARCTGQTSFIPHLMAAFQDEHSLFLVTELCPGGDLRSLLRSGSPPGRNAAKNIAADVLLGLQFMHSLKLVHRDIKPSNILLDAKGRAKLSDVGLAVELKEHSPLRRLAGTRGYWAPEVMCKTGTYLASDLWSFGVLVHVLLTGKLPGSASRPADQVRGEWSPFGCDAQNEANALLREGVLRLDLGLDANPKLTPVSRDFLSRLLVADPNQRLGAGDSCTSSDIDAVMQHPFFSSTHWGERKDVAKAPLRPLFRTPPRPGVKDELRKVQAVLSAARKEDQEKGKTLILTEQDEAKYAHFDYVSPDALTAEVLGWLKTRRAEQKEQPEQGDSCCVQ